MGKVCDSEIIILFFFLMNNIAFGFEDILWPNKRSIKIKGDLYLGGFFPIHKKDGNWVCGEIDEEGLQQLEAFLFTVKKINENGNILPNIKLGALVLDSCYSSCHTLELSMEYIVEEQMGSISGFQRDRSCFNSTHHTPLIGVIGGRSSDVSIQLANLLRLFRIPQVSYKSATSALSNDKLYKYVFRTVAPVNYQVAALFEIIKYFNWTYISVVYSDSEYGSSGYQIIQSMATAMSICIAAHQRVSEATFSKKDYENVIDALLKEKANGVIIFGHKRLAKAIMSASGRKNVIDRFVWLGSESWCGRDSPVKKFPEIAEGSLCATYADKPPRGFYEYFQSLNPQNTNNSNPWFYEYWERKNECRLVDYPLTPHNRKYTENCSTDYSPTDLWKLAMRTPQLVRNSVYVLAVALDDMYKSKCSATSGLCANMTQVVRTELVDYIRNVSFYDDDNETLFQFDKNRDAPPQYVIMNYQKKERASNGSDKYYWRSVGTYEKKRDSDAKLQWNASILKFKSYKKEFPESVCSAPCIEGQTKLQLDICCCWVCLNCSDYSYVNDGQCVECNRGFKPNQNMKNCERIPELHISYDNPWAIGCIIFACFGIVLTVLVSIVFWYYWDTPIVKASSREMSVLMLIGLFLSFYLTFAIVARPSRITCGIVRFFLGLIYTICYAAIVLKTRRIANIFDTRKGYQKSMYRSPSSQLMIAGIIISVEAIINSTWLMYDIPSTENLYPTRGESILICRGSDSVDYLVGLLYPFILMVVCTVYAFRTRKCPDGFNEARHITLLNYSICLIWLAFLPTFLFCTDNNIIRTATVSLLLSLSGIMKIVFLFLPKAYIAILRPDSNTKDVIMRYAGAPNISTTSC